MKLVDFFAAYDGVAGICPTLIADNDVMFWSQKVYEFTFGFITPLQTDDATVHMTTLISPVVTDPAVQEIDLPAERVFGKHDQHSLLASFQDDTILNSTFH